VRDTGIGVPEDRMDRLFRSFSQVEASTTRTYGGTGLGLAISARLVEAMGGTIGALSEPGTGSTFHFAVPTVRSDQVRPSHGRVHRQLVGVTPVKRTPNGASPGLATNSSRLRVLLVEDNLVNQKVALLMLGRLGYRADVAGNGAEALKAVQAAHYDMVLMDIQMPEMDGLEATRAIRSNLSARSQPTIIAMTANATTYDQRLCLEAGMDHYLSKPVRADDLAATLASCGPRTVAGPDPGREGTTEEKSTAQEPSVEAPGSNSDGEGPAVYDSAPLDALVAYLGEKGEAIRLNLIETYLHDVDNRLVAITVASDETNGNALAFTAHALKSASAELGLFALSGAAESIETAFRTAPQHFDVTTEASRLTRECHRAATALRATINLEADPAS
jgi:CheY-like chemotaxis protein